MADFITTQTSFANGEVSPEFYTSDSINGLSRLENMDVLSGGGLSRRAGLVSVANISSEARLFSFSISDNHEYILVLTDCSMDIYMNDTHIQKLKTPWLFADVSQLQCAQRFNTMIFTHPDYPPQTLSKKSDVFTLNEFRFSTNPSDTTTNAPFVRFDDTSDITISITADETANNCAKFTTNKDFWTPENVFDIFLVIGHQWAILEYIDARNVIAITNSIYSLPDGPVSDWYELAFSKRRGWPCSITFHQDRLVFGGTRSWPGGIWLSKVGQHDNFDTGTGLDDEAIFISLQSQQRQQICTVVSSDNLQILTTVGEWAISNRPLTPLSVDIRQHTSVGTYTGHYLPPQQIEGSTVFVAANGRDIRELSLDDLSEKYNANDLCALSKHLMVAPVDIAYNASLRRLYIVRQDGAMSVLNYNAILGISAWGTYKTSGQFISVCVSNDKTYVVVKRKDGVYLEYFDSAILQDAGKYSFSFVASGLPFRASGHNVTRIKLRKISARVLGTKSMYINNCCVSFPNEVYASDATGFSGDISVKLLGGALETITPVWTISGAESYPVTVLSISLYGWYMV